MMIMLQENLLSEILSNTQRKIPTIFSKNMINNVNNLYQKLMGIIANFN